MEAPLTTVKRQTTSWGEGNIANVKGASNRRRKRRVHLSETHKREIMKVYHQKCF